MEDDIHNKLYYQCPRVLKVNAQPSTEALYNYLHLIDSGCPKLEARKYVERKRCQVSPLHQALAD